MLQAQAPEPTCPPPLPAPTPCSTPPTSCSTSLNEDTDTLELPEPTLTAIPTEFQPPDGTVLSWRRYVPASGGPKYPTVLIIHAGGFKTGSPFDGGVERVAADFLRKNYLVLSVTHRLAPCKTITGQHPHDNTPEGILSGRPAQQTNDTRALVRAARADSLSNGWVAIVGGSSGGTHAAMVAFDKTPTPNNAWPKWCQGTKDDRPNAVACLSGAYDFSDWRDKTDQFVQNIDNYTNLCERTAQLPLSPVSFVRPESQQSFKPMIVVNSASDPMPYAQILDVQCALQNAGIDNSKYRAITIPNTDLHAFDYWRTPDGQVPPRRIRDDVFAFFEDHM